MTVRSDSTSCNGTGAISRRSRRHNKRPGHLRGPPMAPAARYAARGARPVVATGPGRPGPGRRDRRVSCSTSLHPPDLEILRIDRPVHRVHVVDGGGMWSTVVHRGAEPAPRGGTVGTGEVSAVVPRHPYPPPGRKGTPLPSREIS